MRYLSVIIIGFVMLFSCMEKKTDSSITIEERHSLNSYLKEEVFKKYDHLKNISFSFIYLTVRDCYCVEENMDFIIKNLNLPERKDVVILVKTNPEFKEEIYLDFVNKLTVSKVFLIDDKKDRFAQHGNLYATDKFFKIKNQQIQNKIELKKQNFDLILSKLTSD